mgnify:CR=1 FL=1
MDRRLRRRGDFCAGGEPKEPDRRRGVVADEPCVAEAIERGELDADDGVRLCVDVGCLGDPTIHDPPAPPTVRESELKKPTHA